MKLERWRRFKVALFFWLAKKKGVIKSADGLHVLLICIIGVQNSV